MPVTDLHVAALRALVVRDFDESNRLRKQIDQEGLSKGYFPLVTSAFVAATRKQFKGKKRSDMVDWVANVRAERDPNGRIDPNVAERLILWVFGKESTDDLDFDTDFGHQTMLLTLLIEEQEFNDAELDEFMRKAREDLDFVMDQEQAR